MSTGWSLYIVFLTLGSVVALGLLLLATSRTNGKDESETTGHVWDDDLQELNNPLPQWWLYLFIGTIIFSLVYLFWYPGLGNFKGMLNWTSTKQFEENYAEMVDRQKQALNQFVEMDIAALTKEAAAMKTAENLFSNNCAVCHGSAGKGAVGFPNLTDKDWLYGNTPEQIQHSIAKGRNGMMPQLGLSEDSIQQLSHYIYGLSGNKVDAELAKKGKAQYALCMGCHGADSKGNQALGAPNLTDNVWLYGDSLQAIQAVLRDGKTGEMPAHETLLTEIEIRLLTAYVTSLSAK
ncbi:MAG: cytochrome-c oxidase, cbb3-type subunit III [Thiolinea sp.]